MSKTAFIVLLASVMLCAGTVSANILRDPMRPDRIKQVEPPKKSASASKSTAVRKPLWLLSAITYTPDASSRSAIVNGQRVVQGSRVGGATIQKIDNNSVLLSRSGKAISLRLFPQIKTAPES